MHFRSSFIRIFNRTGDLVEAGIPAMRIYFFGFFMMAFQFAGQAIFVGLGKAKNAVFFSIFRKVIIVIPLIIYLPSMFPYGNGRHSYGRTGVQLYRRNGMLCDHALHRMAGTYKGERDKNNEDKFAKAYNRRCSYCSSVCFFVLYRIYESI